MLQFIRYHVRCTFVTPLYGTVPLNPDIYTKYIVPDWQEQHNPTEEEVAEEVNNIPEPDEEEGEDKVSYVGFLVEDDQPYMGTHMVRGHCKESCKILRYVESAESWQKGPMRAYKVRINNGLFAVGVDPVHPRKIFLQLPEGGVISHHRRGLRISTAQGERNILVDTATAPVGTKIEFYIQYYPGTGFSEGLLREWWEHGYWVGFGSWRGSGERGRFTYEMTEIGLVDSRIMPG